MINDLVSDFVTRLRNATLAKKETTKVRSSSLVKELIELLKNAGFILWYKDIDSYNLEVALNLEQPIIHIRRLSKPGIRYYSGYKDIPRPRSGLGLVVLSTPKGVLDMKQARKQKVGGELLLEIW